jgi:membrane-bound metal-dependent hydrolase YbcI (DUF457 family)
LAAAGFALLPDLDVFLILFDHVSYLRHHRGLSHSLLIQPGFALLGGLLAWRLGGRRWLRPMFLLGLAVLASHLLLDTATSYGTQLLSPLSRRKFTLDLLFIIDPWLTLMLLPGVAAAARRQAPRELTALSLGLSAGLLLVCGFYHHEALKLARQIGGPEAVKIAALPQPFSWRRWHLLTDSPAGLREAFVELPWLPGKDRPGLGPHAQVSPLPASEPRTPEVAFGPPGELVVVHWPHRTLGVELSSQAAGFLELFQEFARFPHLAAAARHHGRVSATWVDLRFSFPGQAFPFALTLDLDQQGGLVAWDWGGGRRWRVFSQPRAAGRTEATPRSGLGTQLWENEVRGSCNLHRSNYYFPGIYLDIWRNHARRYPGKRRYPAKG